MNGSKGSEFLRSNVLGLVAVFIALTGSAVAASPGGDSATTSKVTNAKFKKLKQRVAALENKLDTSLTGDFQGKFPSISLRINSVGSAEIADNAVTRAKIANDAVDAPKIANNAVNDNKIADDAVGAAELKSVTTPQSGLLNVGAGAEDVQTVSCGGNHQVLGGGALWDAVDPDLRMFNSFPSSGTSWTVNVSNQDGANHGVRATATCLTP